MEYVDQVMVKSVKRRRFSEYVGQVMTKSADGQEIVKIVMKSLAREKIENIGHMIDTRGYFEAVTIVCPPS